MFEPALEYGPDVFIVGKEKQKNRLKGANGPFRDRYSGRENVGDVLA